MLIRNAVSPNRPARCAIAIMAKASHPGRTKTRLVPPLSFEEAADFNTAFVEDIAANVQAASTRADIATYVAYSPVGTAGFFEERLSPDVGLMEIVRPSFGDCLFDTIDQLLALGHESVCVLNSDSPTLPTELLVQTARALAAPGDRAVLGPCNDGGYYLLGLKAPHRRLFDHIDWSTERVKQQTLDRIAEIGLDSVLLPEWYDVDDAAALRMLAGETLFGVPFARQGPASFAAPAATAQLRQLLASADGAARIGLKPVEPLLVVHA